MIPSVLLYYNNTTICSGFQRELTESDQMKNAGADIIQLDEANLPGAPDEWEWAASSTSIRTAASGC